MELLNEMERIVAECETSDKNHKKILKFAILSRNGNFSTKLLPFFEKIQKFTFSTLALFYRGEETFSM
jgi:hypothetical protein